MSERERFYIEVEETHIFYGEEVISYNILDKERHMSDTGDDIQVCCCIAEKRYADIICAALNMEATQ